MTQGIRIGSLKHLKKPGLKNDKVSLIQINGVQNSLRLNTTRLGISHTQQGPFLTVVGTIL